MGNNKKESLQLLSDLAVAELDNARSDVLGFSTYVDVMARIIKGTRGPFTIGIFGEWGMGKTSLMRMVEHEVKSSKDDEMVITVWFNAWMFEQAAYPIVPLVKSIVKSLRSREDAFARAGRSLRATIDVLESLASAVKVKGNVNLPYVGSVGLEFNPDVFRSNLERGKESQLPEDPYEAIFQSLDDVANNLLPDGVTVLVLIDDLDRCFPENAVRLLESIKLVLSRPGFIYLLGASKVVIEEYLQSKYEKQYGIKNFDGKAYLDKMIQLSFDIPPHTVRMNDFTEGILSGLDDEKTRSELKAISDLIARACQNNPRRIIRFINRLLTDAAIYRGNSSSGEAVPIGTFAITRALQQGWKDFYASLISGDSHEDREYCKIIGKWSDSDLSQWKAFGTGDSTLDSALSSRKRNSADPQVLKQVAADILEDRTLKALMDGAVGQQWLNNHRMREASISFLVTQPGLDEEELDHLEAVRGQDDHVLSSDHDDMYLDAAGVVIQSGKGSASLLQRRLRIGYARAARLIELLEANGVVGPSDGARPREVLNNDLDAIRSKYYEGIRQNY